jgi:predicted permease
MHSFLHRKQREEEIANELAFHIESRAADLEREGLAPAEALRRARIEFGGVEKSREEIRASLGLRLFDELRADLRYALRMLRRSPGFTAVAVGSLALGIGANTIIFTLAKNALLDNLAVPQPQQLRILTLFTTRRAPVHAFWGTFYKSADGSQTTSFSYPVYQFMRQQNAAHPVLEDLFAFKALGASTFTVTANGHADIATGQIVSGNYYQQLGVRPALGRAILPSDDGAPGTGAVILLSDGMWARDFGRSPDVIGKTIQVNFQPVTIIGVNPPEFTGAGSAQHSPDIFFPFSMQPVLLPQRPDPSALENKKMFWLQVMGRAREGVPQETVNSALQVWLEQGIRATMPVGHDDVMPVITAQKGNHGMGESNHTFQQPMLVLLSLTGLVLLLACANMANLLLARSAARQREIAVRMALGAGRNRLVRQLLTESLLLSFCGGVAGFLLGYLGRNVIPHIYSAPWRTDSLRSNFDVTIFLFAAGVSLLTGLVFGLAPAWRATRVDVNSGLKDGAASSTRRRSGIAGRSLVILQVALSILLVIGAGLFTRTLLNLGRSTLGFDAQSIVLYNVQAPSARYPKEKSIAFHQRMEERMRRVPGVTSVTLSSIPVLANAAATTSIQPTDQPKINGEGNFAFKNDIGLGFFETYHIRLLYGRSFTDADTFTSPHVAIVNQAFVRKYYGAANPIGRTFRADTSGDVPPLQIVGIVADARYDSLKEAAPPTFYDFYRQLEEQQNMTYVIRTPLPPEEIMPSIRRAAAEIDPDLPIRDVRSQTEQINATISQERLFALLTVSFGGLALLLACIGIYGLMAYSVSRRVNEIGIRIALGAKAGQVRRMILRESTWMALAGIALGLGASFYLARFVKSMLYGLEPTDPVIFAGAALLLLLVALASAYLPARRASRIDPMQALRQE